MPAVAPMVRFLLRVNGAAPAARRRVAPATALRSVPVPSAAACWTTNVALALARVTAPAKVLAPPRTKVPLPEWVRLPPVRAAPLPVVAAMVPAMVRVVPAAGAREPPVLRSRVRPRLAESARSAVVTRAPLAVRVSAAGLAATRSAPRADSAATASLPPLTVMAPV